MEIMSLEEYHSLIGNKKPSKYHNKPVTIDDIRFDSQAEGTRYGQLKLLERANLIGELKIHPRYSLTPDITYEADFEYKDYEKKDIAVEDVKGKKTDVYKLKKKLFLQKYKTVRFIELALDEI